MEESCNIYVHFMRKEILRTNNTYKLHGEYTGFTEFTKSTDGEFTDWIKYDRTVNLRIGLSMIERIKRIDFTIA